MFGLVNKITWGFAISSIIVFSIYFSFYLKFPQLRMFKMFKEIFKKENDSLIKPKETLFMSLASKIGVGSLSGTALAIYYGGLGSIFWIWISTFFIAANAFVENKLSVKFKEKDSYSYKGGPSYYIYKGLKNKKLAVFYAVLIILAYGVGFLGIQSNTIVVLSKNSLNLNIYITALIISVVSFVMILKGLKTITKMCNKIVPLMTGLYILLGLIVVVKNFSSFTIILSNIISKAFEYNSVKGGIIFAIFIGFQRSLFATEAGIGTGGICSAATDQEVENTQGYMGIIGTYFINFIITTITAIIIATYPQFNKTISLNGIELTGKAFEYHFPILGKYLLIIILFLFCFSTIITGYYYCETNYKFIDKKINNYKLIILKIMIAITIFIGGIYNSIFLWKYIDFFVAILAIINIISMFKLRYFLKE